MWTYSQSTGALTNAAGEVIGAGYSGRSVGLNNPSAQDIPDVGPIPQGAWTIGPFFDDPGGKGPCVCHLTPQAGTDALGRSGFMIHGDNSEANHTASEGCVILARVLREAIAESSDTTLQVNP